MDRTFGLFFFILFPLLVVAGESGLNSGSTAKSGSDGAVTFGNGGSFNVWEDEQPGYAVQTGYEGYLVPAESLGIKDVIKSAGIVAALPMIVKVALKLLLKGGVVVLALGAVVSVGVLLTYLLCAFTPVCQLTFQKFGKFHKWDRESMRSLINDDSINNVAEFLSNAIAKYGEVTKKTQPASSL